MIRILDKNEYHKWDQFCHKYGYIFQSSIWGEFKKNISRESSRGLNHYIAAEIDEDKSVSFGMSFFKYKLIASESYIYVPWGPVLTSPKELDLLLEFLDIYSKKNNIAFIKLDLRVNQNIVDSYITEEKELNEELNNILMKYHYINESDSIMPNKLCLMELKSKDDLLKNIPSKYRGRIKNKGNLIFRIYIPPIDADLIKEFYDLYVETSLNKGFKKRSFKYIKEMIERLSSEDSSSIFINAAKSGDKLVASSINVCYRDEVSYLYSGITKDPEYSRLFPGYFLIYSTAQWAIDNGYIIYNLWGGTLSKNISHPWRGFTDFKTNMGAKIVPTQGLLTRYIKNEFIFKNIYRIIRKTTSELIY